MSRTFFVYIFKAVQASASISHMADMGHTLQPYIMQSATLLTVCTANLLTMQGPAHAAPACQRLPAHMSCCYAGCLARAC